MSLAGITTLQSIQAQAAGLELLGFHMSLNSKELKRREVFKKALDFPFFTLKEGRLLAAGAATSSPVPCPAASPAPLCKLGVCLGELSPAVTPVQDSVAKGWCVGHLPNVPGGCSCPQPCANPSCSVLLADKVNLKQTWGPSIPAAPAAHASLHLNCWLHWLSSVLFV